MADPTLTTNLLVTALRGLLPLLEDPETADSSSDSERILREVAEQALSGIAVTVKHLLAQYGQAVIPGVGVLTVVQDEILVEPDADLAQFVFLGERDSQAVATAAARLVIRYLQNVASLLPMAAAQIVDEEVTDEEKLLHAIFGQSYPKSVNRTVEQALVELIRSGRAAGIPFQHIQLDEDSNAADGSAVTRDPGRSLSARPKSRPRGRRRAADLLNLSIRSLEISLDSYALLRKSKIESVRELAALSESELRRLPGWDSGSVDEIKEALGRMGLSLNREDSALEATDATETLDATDGIDARPAEEPLVAEPDTALEE